MIAPHLLSLVTLGLLIVQLAAQGADPTREPSAGAFTEVPLETGRLYLGPTFKPAGGEVDLLVHFHGHPPVVCSNLLASRKAAALVILNFNGLSAAYARPFQEPQAFPRVLSNATAALSRHFGRPLRAGRLAVSSFSAGYGAVREILKDPEGSGRITDLVLADSLYASYVDPQGHRVPQPDQMQDFVRFARRAAEGQVRFIVTHSQQVPGSYASTRETAEVLLQAADARRVPALGEDDSGMTLESAADRGGFHLRSYTGDGPQDHMNHLRRLAGALRRTSLPDAAASVTPP